jgi:twitching motility protein PilU
VNSPYVSELIKSGETEKIKEAMEQSLTAGSQTFEQALFALYQEGKISLDEALANADSRTNLSWLINNERRDGSDTRPSGDAPEDVATGSDFAGFTLNSDKA